VIAGRGTFHGEPQRTNFWATAGVTVLTIEAAMWGSPTSWTPPSSRIRCQLGLMAGISTQAPMRWLSRAQVCRWRSNGQGRRHPGAMHAHLARAGSRGNPAANPRIALPRFELDGYLEEGILRCSQRGDAMARSLRVPWWRSRRRRDHPCRRTIPSSPGRECLPPRSPAWANPGPSTPLPRR
jgi:hypothetical protein